MKGEAYSSADASSSGGGDGSEEGSRAVLGKSQKSEGSKDGLGVGKHLEGWDEKN